MCSFAYKSGASCSKLTMSLVNDSLKFQMAILQIHSYFLLKKCENPLHYIGFSHFFNKKFALQRILTFFQQKITVYLQCKGFLHFFNKKNQKKNGVFAYVVGINLRS